MMKVLLTATVQSHICQFHKPLVRMLRENGDVEIHVAAHNNLAEKNGLQLDFVDRVFEIPFARSPFSRRNSVAYRELKKIIEAGEYDIIHCNTPVGGVVTRLAARCARKSGTRVLYTAHGFHFFKGASWLNWWIYYPIERLLAHCCDTLITINEEDYRRAIKNFSCSVSRIHGVGVDAQRYHDVPCAEKMALKHRLGFQEKQRLILCIGELLPNKNQAMAIRAMKKVIRSIPDALLLLAGNGPELASLESLVQEYGLENHVRFLGYTLNLEEYQRVCDVSVSCSYREGLGLNLIEAMLTGNPVVATHNRGHNELVQDGVNGFLVEPNDSDALARYLIQLLSDADLSERFGAAGKEMAQAYTAEAVAGELKGIYFTK